MNKIHVLVVARNQSTHIARMVAAISSQLPMAEITYALDRCSDDSEEVLRKLGISYVINYEGGGHQAGRTRNLGLDSIHQDKSVLLLDGDRIPNGLTEGHLLSALEAYPLTMMMVGDSDHRKHLFTDELRANPKTTPGRIGLEDDNLVYSCGLLVRSSFIKQVRILQGTLFHPYFHGRYGSEDMYLGYLAEALGYDTGLFPKHVYLDGRTFNSNTKVVTDYNRPIRNFLKGELGSKLAEYPSASGGELMVACSGNKHLVGCSTIPPLIVKEVRQLLRRHLMSLPSGYVCPQYDEEKFIEPKHSKISDEPLNRLKSRKNLPRVGSAEPTGVAFYTPLYEPNDPKLSWGVSMLSTLRKMYPGDDIYFSINSPCEPSIVQSIMLEFGATVIDSPLKRHGSSLDIAREVLSKKNYKVMIHIEQDVILKGDVKSRLLQEMDDTKASLVLNDVLGSGRVDISVFALDLREDVPSMGSFTHNGDSWVPADVWGSNSKWWSNFPELLSTLRRTQDYALQVADLAAIKKDLLDSTTDIIRGSNTYGLSKENVLVNIYPDHEYKKGVTLEEACADISNLKFDDSALYWSWVFDTARLMVYHLMRQGKVSFVKLQDDLCTHVWHSRERTLRDYLG